MALIEPEWMHTHKEYQALRDRTKLVQFLLALADDFESARTSILHQKPLPSVHDILPELLAEQTRKGITALPPSNAAFIASLRTSYSHYGVKKPFRVYCRKKGHWK